MVVRESASGGFNSVISARGGDNRLNSGTWLLLRIITGNNKKFFIGEFKGLSFPPQAEKTAERNWTLSGGDNPIGPATGGPQSGVSLLKKYFLMVVRELGTSLRLTPTKHYNWE